MKKKNLFIIFLCFIFCCLNSYSNSHKFFENADYRTIQITMKDGLSQNNVEHIFQDSKGLIWISTTDGLNRYDGYEFRHFNLMDEKGLEASLIFMVDEDKNSNIWVATDNGIFVYFRSSGIFKKLKNLIPTHVNFDYNNQYLFKNINIDQEGFIWTSTLDNKQIVKFSFDYKNSKIKDIKSISTHISSKITKIVSSKKKVFFASDKSLLCYDKNSNTLSRCFEDSLISDIALSGSNELLVLCYDRVYLYDIISKEYHVISFGVGSKYLSKNINHIFYHNNRVYLLSEDKIFYSDLVNFEFSEWKIISKYLNSDFSGFIVDNNGSIWTYINRNGILRFDDNKNNFKIYDHFGLNDIQTVVQDKLGHYWIGTATSGLYVVDADFNILFSAFQGKTVQYITKSALNDNIYFTVRNDAVYLSEDLSNNFKKVTSIFPYSIRKLCCYGHYLWMGTYNNGLIRFDLKNNNFKSFSQKDGLPSNIVRNILIDKNNNMWIATNKGLSCISHEYIYSDSINFNNYLSNNYIMALLEDDKGFLWVGTLGKGLKKIDIRNNLFKVVSNYNLKLGLSNNMINSIEKDDNNNIWIGTNQGINFINNNNGQIRLFSLSDGLQSFAFNELASCRSYVGNNKALIFGGVKGLNVIYPSKIIQDTVAVRPILTDIKLFNVSLFNYPFYFEITPNSIIETKNISLKYDQNSFSFNFSAPYFIKSSKIKYKYKLEGFDKSWMLTSSDQKIATYTNIPSGNYIFRVKACNYDEKWNDKELRVAVNISSPWWNTIYAYFTYVLFLILFIYLMILYVKNNIKKKEIVAKAYFEKQQSDKMLDVTTRFYTNISHELRTPLTLIFSPIQLILNNKDNYLTKDTIRLINNIKHNIQSMRRLIDNLMDFSKNENGKLKADFSQNDIVQHIERIVEQFEFWCIEKKIELYFKSSFKDLFLVYDINFMEQIMYNLISNAIKYSTKGDSITISLFVLNENPIILVKDTGIGMNEEQKKHLFERFYSKGANSTKIEDIGIGLYMTKVLVEMMNCKISCESTLGVGTTFKVIFPFLSKEKPEKLDINRVVVGKIKNEKKVVLIDSNKKEKPLENTQNVVEKPLLLIVDDNNDICLLLKDVFEDSFKIMIAVDGQKAWDLIINFMPDIVVSDVMMPIMDGYELCKKLKSDKRSCHVPIILLTAKNSSQDKINGYKVKADSYLTKPFEHSVLKEMIFSILKNRRLIAENNKSQFVNPETKINNKPVYISDIDEKLIEQIKLDFEKNISNPKYTIAQLCKYIGVSRFILNKKFRNIYNTTPVDFLRDYRLNKAAELLINGNHTISEITYFVGFSDLKNFRVCFKEKFKMLPQEYKKKYNIEA